MKPSLKNQLEASVALTEIAKMVATTDNAWEKKAESRARWVSPLLRVIKGVLFLHTKSSDQALTKLNTKETKAFLKVWQEPIVYNEELTAALEAHDREFISEWNEKS